MENFPCFTTLYIFVKNITETFPNTSKDPNGTVFN